MLRTFLRDLGLVALVYAVGFLIPFFVSRAVAQDCANYMQRPNGSRVCFQSYEPAPLSQEQLARMYAPSRYDGSGYGSFPMGGFYVAPNIPVVPQPMYYRGYADTIYNPVGGRREPVTVFLPRAR